MRSPTDPVWGHGESPCRIMFVGEALGREESQEGIPFVGKSGRVLWGFTWRYARVSREDVYVTNLVKVRPPVDKQGKDTPPTQDMVDMWTPFLLEEVETVRPEYVVTLGRHSTDFFLPHLKHRSMETVQGMPFQSRLNGVVGALSNSMTVVPIMHPASGLHRPEMLPRTSQGLESFGKILRGEYVGYMPHVAVEQTYYRANGIFIARHRGRPVVVDTEGLPSSPYSVQITTEAGTSRVVLASEGAALITLRDWIAGAHVIMHNATWDLKVLLAMGIDLVALGCRITCSMGLSFLTQAQPQGLKGLGPRITGIDMREYDDVVTPHHEKAKAEWFRDMKESTLWEVAGVSHDTYEERTSEKTGKPLKPRLIKCECDICTAKGIINKAITQFDKGQSVVWENRYGTIPKTVDLEPFPTKGFHLVPEEEFLAYAGADSDITFRCVPVLEEEIARLGAQEARRVDMGVLPMIDAMMRRGLLVDKEAALAFQTELREEIAVNNSILSSIVDLPEDFNSSSGDQIADLFFKRLHLPSLKRTKGDKRESTDDEVLEYLMGLVGIHPVAQECVRLVNTNRGLEKLDGSYVTKLLDELSPGNVHYPDIKHTRVVSGRLAGWLLTWPRPDTPYGKRLRDLVVARAGRLVGSWDLSQIEPRSLAHLSQDPGLLDIFRSGVDLYRAMASKAMGIPLEQVTKKIRQIFKVVVLAVMYGLTARSAPSNPMLVGAGIHITEEEFQQFIDDFNRAFPLVDRLRQRVLEQTRRDGYVQGVSGRVRYLPAIHLLGWKYPEKHMRLEAERQAFNFYIQEYAQYIMKDIMMEVWDSIRELPEGAVYPLLQIHDDLVLDLDEDYAQLMDTLMQEALGVVARKHKFSVPLKAKAKIAARWGSFEDD